jgi:hypothetical protein
MRFQIDAVACACIMCLNSLTCLDKLTGKPAPLPIEAPYTVHVRGNFFLGEIQVLKFYLCRAHRTQRNGTTEN